MHQLEYEYVHVLGRILRSSLKTSDVHTLLLNVGGICEYDGIVALSYVTPFKIHQSRLEWDSPAAFE